MRTIVAVPRPKIWHSMGDSTRIFPGLKVERNSIAWERDITGSTKSVPVNRPVNEWRDFSCAGLLVNAPVTNQLSSSIIADAGPPYGLKYATNTAKTPHGVTLTALAERANLQTYDDHVMDFTIAAGNTTSTARTYSFTVRQDVVRESRKAFGLRIASALGNINFGCRFANRKLIGVVTNGGDHATVTYKDIGGGWYRIFGTIHTPHTINGVRLYIYDEVVGGQWANVDTGFEFYLGELQIENRRYGGRPIFTTNGSATHVGDNCYIEIAPSVTQTIFVESEVLDNNILAASGALCSSTGSQHLSMLLFSGTRGQGAVAQTTSGVLGASRPMNGKRFKQALSYNSATGDVLLVTNGVQTTIATKVTGQLFNRFVLGSSGAAGNHLEGYVRKVGYWDSALTALQLVELTK